MAIKKVQDDQAFDVTQDEILGRLFGSSSIIRVVEALHPSVRDSLPPSSALRFNPQFTRKRERRNFLESKDNVSLLGPSKRPKLADIDPDRPRPSCETNIDSSNGHLSQSQMIDILKDYGSPCHYYSRKPSLQISETPEPAHFPMKQVSKGHIESPIGIRQDLASHKYEPKINSYRSLEIDVLRDSDEINSNAKNFSQQTNIANSSEPQNVPSPSSSISSENSVENRSNPVEKENITHKKLARQSSNELGSAYQEIQDTKETASCNGTSSHHMGFKVLSESSPSSTNSYKSENADRGYYSSPRIQRSPLVVHKDSLTDEFGPRSTSHNPLDIKSKNFELEIDNTENNHPEVTEERGNEGFQSQSSEIQNNDVSDAAESAKRRLITNETFENSQNTRHCEKPAAKTHKNKVRKIQNKSQASPKTRNKIQGSQLQEEKILMQHADNNSVSQNENTKHQHASNNPKELQEESDQDSRLSLTPASDRAQHSPSPSLTSVSKTFSSSSRMSPGNQRQKIIQNNTPNDSSFSIPAINTESASNDLNGNTDRLLDSKKVSFLDEKKKKKASKAPSRIVPNLSTTSQDKSSNQKSSKKVNGHISGEEINSTPQKISYTPSEYIEPYQEVYLAKFLVLPPKRSSKTLTPANINTGGATSTPGLKAVSKTPIVPPRRSQAILPNQSKSKSLPTKGMRCHSFSVKISIIACINLEQLLIGLVTGQKSDKLLAQIKKLGKSAEEKKCSSDTKSQSFSIVSRPNLISSSNPEKDSETEKVTENSQLFKLKETSHEDQDKDNSKNDTDSEDNSSHNPSDRDSRSPIEFHRNSQLAGHKTSPSSSPDSSENENFGSRASQSSTNCDTSNQVKDKEHLNTSLQADVLNTNLGDKFNIRHRGDLNTEKPGYNPSRSSSELQVPNSSASSKVILPTIRHNIKKNLTGSSLSQAHGRENPLYLNTIFFCY